MRVTRYPRPLAPAIGAFCHYALNRRVRAGPRPCGCLPGMEVMMKTLFAALAVLALAIPSAAGAAAHHQRGYAQNHPTARPAQNHRPAYRQVRRNIRRPAARPAARNRRSQRAVRPQRTQRAVRSPQAVRAAQGTRRGAPAYRRNAQRPNRQVNRAAQNRRPNRAVQNRRPNRRTNRAVQNRRYDRAQNRNARPNRGTRNAFRNRAGRERFGVRGNERYYRGNDRYRRDNDRRFVYRGRYHRAIRAPAFRYPRGYGYRHWARGDYLPSIFLSAPFFFYDYYDLGVAPPPPGYRWVRYGPDLLLVDIYTGYVVDVVYDVFY